MPIRHCFDARRFAYTPPAVAEPKPEPVYDDLASKRASTDHSLQTERAKTDDELAKLPTKAETDADAVLGASRQRADDVLARSRKRMDEKLGHLSAAERGAVDSERRGEDALIAVERENEDAVLATERAERRLMFASLVAAERAATDSHLNDERAHADVSSGGRDDLLAAVAHDADSILLAVDLTMDGLVQHLEQQSGANNEVAAARRVSESVVVLRRLTADLVDYSGIAAGKLNIRRATVDLVELLDAVVDTFQAMAREESRWWRPLRPNRSSSPQTRIASCRSWATC